MSGVLNVPFTDEQQAGVQWALDRHNSETGSSLLIAEFGINMCQTLFNNYADQRSNEKEQNASIRDKYLALDDINKASVEAFIDSL